MLNQVYRDSVGRFFAVTSSEDDKISIRYNNGDAATLDRDEWNLYPKKLITRFVGE